MEDKSGKISPEELQGAAVALGISMEENIMVLLGERQLSFEEFFDRMTAKLDEKAGFIRSTYTLARKDYIHNCLFSELIS